MRRGPLRAIRGLTIGHALSLANLVGAFLTLSALGGLGEWSRIQFVGLFGLIEVATGAAFVICPNIWRLPVAEGKLGRRGEDIRFAASTILIPHWVGGVKCIGGGICIVIDAAVEGVGPPSLGLPLVVLYVMAGSVGLSMLFARVGVMRPDVDVLGIVIRQPGRPERALPEISLGSSVVQVLLNVCSFPSVKLMPPDVLYRPEFARRQRPCSGAQRFRECSCWPPSSLGVGASASEHRRRSKRMPKPSPRAPRLMR